MATALPSGVALRALGDDGMVRRLASAVVLLPVFVLILMQAPAYLFDALVVAASALALWELTRLLELGGRAVHRMPAVVAGAALTAAFAAASRTPDPFVVPAFVLAVVVAAVLAAPLWRPAAPATEPAANTLLAVLYIGWLLGYAILLQHSVPSGDQLVLFVVGVTWIGETMAYVVGSTLGRHKLAPVISPRKTVEGAVAQVAASIVAAVALGAWLVPACGIAAAIAGGALLGVVGQVGDLTESVIKRSVGTKDTGGIIPGHGGVLDRIDSLLFNLPAFYYFSRLVSCT
jgi:phosphatidate cytidylyltransferase